MLSNTLQPLVNPLRATLILKWGGGIHTLQSILEITCNDELGVFRTYGEKKYQSQHLVYSNRKSKSICCAVLAKNHTGFYMGVSKRKTDMVYITYRYIHDLPAVLIRKHICKRLTYNCLGKHSCS